MGCRRRDGWSKIWKLSFLLIWTEKKKKKKQSGDIFLSSNCRQSAKNFGGKKTLGSDFEDRLRQRWRPKHLTRASCHRTLLIGWRRLCDEIFSKEFALLRYFTLKLKAQIRVVGIDKSKKYLGLNLCPPGKVQSLQPVCRHHISKIKIMMPDKSWSCGYGGPLQTNKTRL